MATTKDRFDKIVVKELQVENTLRVNGVVIDTELAALAGLTASVAELNTLDGFTGTTAMLNFLAAAGLVVGDFDKLAAIDATATQINFLTAAGLASGDLVKLAAIEGSAANIDAAAANAALDAGAPRGVAFVIGAESGGDTINVALQLQDAAGGDLAVRGSVLAYLTDDANGDAIVAAAPDGGVTIGTDGLAVPLVAGKAFQLVSEADGDIDLNLVEAGAKTCRLVVVLPNGKLVVSGAITFAG